MVPAAALGRAGIAAIRDRGNQDKMGMRGGNCNVGLRVQGTHIGTPLPPGTPGTLTCSSTRKMYQPMMSSSADAAATAAMVPRIGG